MNLRCVQKEGAAFAYLSMKGRSHHPPTAPYQVGSIRAGGVPIDRFVIVLQENHSFDNYFGTYPNADGTTGKNLCLPRAPGSAQCVKPFHDSNRTPAEMSHNWETAHSAYDGGRMDAFVYSEANTETMGFFDRSDLPRYWAAADQFVLCDRYFTSVMSESAPNHLFLVAGTAGGLLDNNVPSTFNFPPIFQSLDQQRVSWRCYGFSTWFERFAYVQGSPAVQRNFVPPDQFAQDLAAGALPQVCWVIGAPGGTEHPPQNIQTGQNSVLDAVVNPVGTSAYWNSTAMVVTWDDYGGFFDHVPPPQVDPFGYGFRVPALLLSPYAKAGFVDHSIYDHTSILRSIENRFGIPPLAARDSAANDLTNAFDFAQQPRRFIPL